MADLSEPAPPTSRAGDRPSRSTPALTIIVPTYNRADVLMKALEHIEAQTVDPGELEVIVSDDGSTDATALQVHQRTWPFRFTYLRQDNAGPAAARNQALRHATAPLTLFINDDTLLAPDAVERHLDAHARLAGEHLMVLGAFDLLPSFLSTRLGHVLQHTSLLFQYCMLERGDVADHNFAYTCNLSLPTQAARSVGFDETFRGPAGEDIDFGKRLGDRGWSVCYDPLIGSRHDHRMTVRSLARTARTRGRGQAIYYRKHGFPKGDRRNLRSVLTNHDTIDAQMEPSIRRLERALENVPWSPDVSIHDDHFVDLTKLFLVYELAGIVDDPTIHAALASVATQD